MKYFYVGLFSLINLFFSQECNSDSDWCYESTINQAFYIIEGAFINGNELTRGNLEPDGTVSCPNENCDIVGAFNGDICVGWSIYYINDGLDNKFTLNVNGYDGFEYSEGYLLPGQVPQFKIFNMSTNNIIDATWTECYNIMTGEESECQYTNFGGFIVGELNAEDNLEAISELLSQSKFSIEKIYPNPFNPITQIDYAINISETISISIFNLNGIKIESQILGIQNPGKHSWIWDATYHSSGEYIIQLKTPTYSLNQKVILIK
jgi:hypothetical protein